MADPKTQADILAKYGAPPPSSSDDAQAAILAKYGAIPPSQQAVSAAEPVGQIEALVRGAAQGPTFGFSDEAYGAAKGLFTARPGESTLDSIKRNIAEQNARETQAFQQNPWTYGGSELASAIAVNPLGELGMLAKAGTRAEKVAEAKAAYDTLAPAQKIISGVKTGAQYGALSGAGKGEGGVDERLADASKGALVGGAFGGALSGAVEGIRGAGTLASKIPGTPGVAAKAFVKESEGVRLFRLKELQKEMYDAAENFVDTKIAKPFQGLQDDITNVLKTAEEKGTPIDTNVLEGKLSELEKLIPLHSKDTPERAELTTLRDKLKNAIRGPEQQISSTKMVPGKTAAAIPSSEEQLQKLEQAEKARGMAFNQPVETNIQKITTPEGATFHQLISNVPEEGGVPSARVVKQFAIPDDEAGEEALKALTTRQGEEQAKAAALGGDFNGRIQEVADKDGNKYLQLQEIAQGEPTGGTARLVKQIPYSEGTPASTEIAPLTETTTVRPPKEVGPRDLYKLEKGIGEKRRGFQTSEARNAAQDIDEAVTGMSNEALPGLADTTTANGENVPGIRSKYGDTLKAFESLGLKRDELVVPNPDGSESINPLVTKRIQDYFNQVAHNTPNTNVRLEQIQNMMGFLKNAGVQGIDEAFQELSGKVENAVLAKKLESGIAHSFGVKTLGAVAGRGLRETEQRVVPVLQRYAPNSTPLQPQREEKATSLMGSKPTEIQKTSAALYNAAPEELKGVASVLSNSKFSYLGQALDKAVDTKNEQTKNAALFSILQNPDARAILQGAGNGNK